MSGRTFFFIVGAQRSSTTYLYTVLDEHPAIQMAKPMRPEPKHFTRPADVALGADHYAATYFTPHPTKTICGEKSVCYFEMPEVPGRIKGLFPDAKILIILRNPVERALSNYAFSVEYGLETRSLEDTFLYAVPPPRLPHPPSMDPFAYITRSLYLPMLKTYIDAFGRDQVHVIVQEDFVNRVAAIQAVYRFLGAAPDYAPRGWATGVNASKTQQAIPPTVREALQNDLLPQTNALEDYLGLSLAGWRQG